MSLKSWKDALGSDAKSYKQLVTERDAQVGSFLEFDPGRSKADAKNPKTELQNIPFSVKDNIAVKNYHCTCGSKILETYVSPYTATAVKKLEEAGALVVGKTNLDEFGMGSSTDNSAFKKTHNPWDLSRVAGGSSGGSAASVAAGLVPFSLGSDTGGSVRQPASFCGVYGLKPSYGSVSRFGLVAYASSLEVIGVVSKDLGLAKSVFETMRGIDENDHTTVDISNEYGADKPVSKIGFLKVEGGLDPLVEKSYKECAELVKNLGYAVEWIDISSLEYAVPAYYTIASAEASANLARFNGIRYGHRPVFSENPDELVRKARDEGFGKEVKLRVILGTYVLRSGFQDQYYHRAQKVRTIIRADFDKAYEKVDAIIMPVFPTSAFKHGDTSMTPFQQKVADKFTTVANLTGHPALSFPFNVEAGLPVGFQVTAPLYKENRLFEIAQKIGQKKPLVDAGNFASVYS